MLGSMRDRVIANHRTRRVVLAARRPTARARDVPSFAIVGAQKAGTTTLYDWLCCHDSVAPAIVKETRHFDLSPTRPVDAYRTFFPLWSRRRGLITGEATPEYLHLPWVPDALSAAVPDVRVIVILRDPAERAYSHFRHSVARGEEHLDFESAIRAEPRRLWAGAGAPGSPAAMRYSRYSYLTRGRYAEQLQRWQRAVAAEHILTIWFDDLAVRPQAVMDDVTNFLGLSSMAVDGLERRNVGVQSLPPSEETLATLREHFAQSDEQLTELVGRRPYWVR